MINLQKYSASRIYVMISLTIVKNLKLAKLWVHPKNKFTFCPLKIVINEVRIHVVLGANTIN